MSSESTTAPALTFAPHIFASVAPQSYLHTHLASGGSSSTRPNGRTASDFRAPSVNTGSLTQCAGSAVVRLASTAVVCGVRGEILLADDVPNPPQPAGPDADDAAELASLGLLVPNVELSTGCGPSHIPGNAPSTIAQSLVQRIRDLLYSTNLVQARDLRIFKSTTDDAGETVEKVAAYWTLYIDILFISLDGGAFDAAWGAVMAALRDVRLPRGFWDAERDMLLCSDVPEESSALTLRGLPIAASFAVFEPSDGSKAPPKLLADPDSFEEDLCGETICVVLDCNTSPVIQRLEKSGGSSIDKDQMQKLIPVAQSRWASWQAAIST